MISNYSEPATAEEDWNMLKGLVADDVIKGGARALVNRDNNGKVHVKDTTNEPGLGLVGAVGRALVGLIFPPPNPPLPPWLCSRKDALALTRCASTAAQCCAWRSPTCHLHWGSVGHNQYRQRGRGERRYPLRARYRPSEQATAGERSVVAGPPGTRVSQQRPADSSSALAAVARSGRCGDGVRPGQGRRSPPSCARPQLRVYCDSFGPGSSTEAPRDRRDTMSKKSKTIEKITTANVELKKTLAGVRGQLTKTRAKLTKATERADRWKKEAAAHRTAAARSDARVEKLQKSLDRATAALKPAPATKADKAAASGDSTTEPSTAYGLTTPDETWTVVQLRAEAHARGLTGMSDKTKEQLLAALT